MSGELEKYLRANSDIIRILEIVRELDLKDSWLCAGTIRNFIWNQYHFDKTTDVDIVFFDEGISYEKTLEIENHLHYMYPEYKWELKNQVLCIFTVRTVFLTNHQKMQLKNFQKDVQLLVYDY